MYSSENSIHYNKDWDWIGLFSKNPSWPGQRTASITTRIETSSPSRRTEPAGSENSIHYNKDWDNFSHFFEFFCETVREQHPLQQGLRQQLDQVLVFRAAVREQHPLQQGLRPHRNFPQISSTLSENSIHYNKDWDCGYCHVKVLKEGQRTASITTRIETRKAASNG